MTVPRFLQKLASNLFDTASLQDNFLTHFANPTLKESCLIWMGEPDLAAQTFSLPLKWVTSPIPSIDPGKHPLHDAGAYYVLDASSVLEASVLLGVTESVRHVVDVCAAPGGKSLFAWRLFHPEFLLSNETIDHRLKMLISNLKRCGVAPSSASCLTPQGLKTRFAGSFDVVIVDAPCSGQSLLVRGDKALGCFHPRVIGMNSRRQKKILAESAGLVAGGGALAYMTCTFSRDENEDVIDWFLERFPDFKAVSVSHLAPYQSHLTEKPMYRFWPGDQMGSGGFATLLQNTATEREEFYPGDHQYAWSCFK